MAHLHRQSGWRRSTRSFLGMAVILLGVAGGSGGGNAADPPSTASVVMFNTVCAQCHELECSGRLSFSCDAAAAARARGHIENYAGQLDEEKTAELYALLEYTKTHCDYYAPGVPVPADGRWTAAGLQSLATPAHTGWFVPLGAMDKGKWQMEISLGASQPVDLEVVTRHGIVLQEYLPAGTQHASVQMDVATAGLHHFLRLISRGPVAVDALAVTPP